jgi:hypothetical protein
VFFKESAMNKAAQLLAAVSDIGKEFDEKVKQYALTVCLFPPKPWHIAQKQAAIDSFHHYLKCKRHALLSKCDQERVFNRCTKALNDAIYYHRLQVKQNTAAQTFGRVL